MTPFEVRGDGVLRTRAEAEAYVASVCFKHGPPTLAGVEIEWMPYDPARPDAPVDPDTLRAALGDHTPASLDPAAPARPLPAGSVVTVEPGGQVEISSAPERSLTSLVDAVGADAAHLHSLLAAHRLAVHDRAADPVRPAQRVLDLPRYAAMECVFDRVGPHGRSGMCSTSAVQVSLDAGPASQITDRWAALHELGPVLLAAFANSPVQHGHRTGWKSARQACWLSLDPARTAPPPGALLDADPALEWARRVVGTPLLCVRGTGSWAVPPSVTFDDWVSGRCTDGILARPPTQADLDYHVSTLFPPVRPQGHLEVRYVDGQPGDDWALPAAVLAALTSSPEVLGRVREACEPVRDAWVTAARDALADPALARAAGTLFPLACEVLAAAGHPLVTVPARVLARLREVTERRVLQGLCPADEVFPFEESAAGAGAPFPPGLYRSAPDDHADPARNGDPVPGHDVHRIQEGVR
ncbi:ergothioneine biosynthesis glutamate--cysteine ligase EgtA [Pseudonocardia phyllosphaerae]|uniref:ergothioneine biosynthesis glutamate--cysteine ligase EgtA n=1 Tax=Pseudonocardia phyllosphaerae TaxID=3390502 RepID=UPI003979512A